jgi:hypothetical protein
MPAEVFHFMGRRIFAKEELTTGGETSRAEMDA